MSSSDYPVTIEPTSTGGFVATFRDVPEAMAEGETLEEVKQLALDALITSIDFYRDDFRVFPAPSLPLQGESLIHLPASVVSKLLLLNTMIEQNCRPADLARKMAVRPQDVTRLLQIRHSTKIDTIERAVYALGHELTVSIS